jgi:hypothetical protein
LTLNFPSVALRNELANTSGVPNKLSKDLGKLDTKRQLSVGKLCAIDGATNAAAPAPIVAFFKKERLCISTSLTTQFFCFSYILFTANSH